MRKISGYERTQLHPWCFDWDERKQVGAAQTGAPEQRYLASAGAFAVQLAVLEVTRDFEAFCVLAESKHERIRSGVPARMAQLGVIDGGSAEHVLRRLTDDASDTVRCAVAKQTSDPALKRFMAKDAAYEVRRSCLSGSEDAPLIAWLAKDLHPYVRAAAADASKDRVLLTELLDDEDDWVRSRVSQRLRALRR